MPQILETLNITGAMNACIITLAEKKPKWEDKIWNIQQKYADGHFTTSDALNTKNKI